MAINPGAKYATRIAVPDANYPYGSAQNESVSGADDGTPLEKDWVNDYMGLNQGLLNSESVTPTGTPDTVLANDQIQALEGLIAGSDYYTSTGTANAVVLTSETNRLGPAAYRIGQRIRYKASQTNTAGSVTVNVNGLGAIPVHQSWLANGATPTISIGLLRVTYMIEMVYQQTDDTLTDYWRITTVEPLPILYDASSMSWSPGLASQNIYTTPTNKTLTGIGYNTDLKIKATLIWNDSFTPSVLTAPMMLDIIDNGGTAEIDNALILSFRNPSGGTASNQYIMIDLL